MFNQSTVVQKCSTVQFDSRSKDLYELFLDWKMDGHSFQYDQCLSLNFDYNDDQLSIPQVSMTPDFNTKLDFDSPSSCIFVVIGGKYLNMIGKVMDSIRRTKTIAVFLMSNYQDNVVIDVDSIIKRYKSTPVMVK